ncbi:MAG TPA: hypothetical protein VN700_05455 [Vicinamibacterales bacterium]|nr:hypothetical protein [Vicinamibacterales bacterium]
MTRREVSGRGGWKAAALVVFLAAIAAASCGRSRPPAPLQAVLVEAEADRPALIRVTGLSSAEAGALSSAADLAVWQRFMRVMVAGGEDIAMAGTYRIADGALEFEPKFPLDRGRDYVVRLYPSRLPAPRSDVAIAKVLRRAAGPSTAATVVTSISPAAGVWPENLLRFYIHFSGPMSRTTAHDYVRLVDDKGVEIEAAFLRLDVDLWNTDHTRFTVFFDPGRVKRGIRPNRELGRALIAGRKYAITVDARWADSAGGPLGAPFRHEFAAGPPEDRGIDPKRWTIGGVTSGSREVLVVQFPWALDHALLQRALGVARAEKALDGVVTIAGDDRAWRFTPASPWSAGAHELVILTVLEDPSGNRVGRPFEFEMFKAPAPESGERVTVPFVVR